MGLLFDVKNLFTTQDTSFIRFGVMLTPKKSWGPRSDRDDDQPISQSEVGGETNEGFEKTETKDNLEVVVD